MKKSSEKETEQEESHSSMLGKVAGELGKIAGEVIEFCVDPNCTTLSAVRLMKAELLQLQAEKLRKLADDQINNSYIP